MKPQGKHPTLKRRSRQRSSLDDVNRARKIDISEIKQDELSYLDIHRRTLLCPSSILEVVLHLLSVSAAEHIHLRMAKPAMSFNYS